MGNRSSKEKNNVTDLDNTLQKNDFENYVDKDAETNFYDEETQGLSECQSEIMFNKAQTTLRKNELADKMWKAVFDNSYDQYENNEISAVEQQNLSTSCETSNFSQECNASSNIDIELCDDTVSKEAIEIIVKDEIETAVNDIIKEAEDGFKESPSKKLKLCAKFESNNFENSLDASKKILFEFIDLTEQRENFKENEVQKDVNKIETKTFHENPLTGYDNSNSILRSLLQNSQVTNENVFTISSDDSEDQNINEVFLAHDKEGDDLKSLIKEDSSEKEVKSNADTNIVPDSSIEGIMQQLTIDSNASILLKNNETAFETCNNSLDLNINKVLYINNGTEKSVKVVLDSNQTKPNKDSETEVSNKTLEYTNIPTPSTNNNKECLFTETKYNAIENKTSSKSRRVINDDENSGNEFLSAKKPRLNTVCERKRTVENVVAGSTSTANNEKCILSEIKEKYSSVISDDEGDNIQCTLTKKPKLSTDVDQNKTEANCIDGHIKEAVESAEPLVILSNVVVKNATICNVEKSISSETEIKIKDVEEKNSNLTSKIINKTSQAIENTQKMSEENIDCEKITEHITVTVTKKAKIKTCNGILPNESILLYPPPKYDKQPEKLSLDFLKRFRKPYNKMTRNDLEDLVLQKIVETIVFEKEFADLRITIENQENLIKRYRSRLLQLVKQFHDFKTLHESVVKDLKERNSQYLMPKRVTRSVGLQVQLQNLNSNHQTCHLNTTLPFESETKLTNDGRNNVQQVQKDEQFCTEEKLLVTTKSSSMTSTENTQTLKLDAKSKITKKNLTNDQFIENSQITVPNLTIDTKILSPIAVKLDSTVTENITQKKQEPSKELMPIIVELDSPIRECSTERDSKPSEKLQTPQLLMPITMELDQPSSTVKTSESANELKLPKSSMPIVIELDSPVRKNTAEKNSQLIDKPKLFKPLMPTILELDSPVRENLVEEDSQNINEPVIIELDSPLKTLQQTTTTAEIMENQIEQLPNENSVIDLTDNNEESTEINIQPHNLPFANIINLSEPQTLVPNFLNRNCPVRIIKNSGSNLLYLAPRNTISDFNYNHLVPLPPTPPTMPWNSYWKLPPPKPSLLIQKVYDRIDIIWNIEEPLNNFAKIKSYELFVYHLTNGPSLTNLWLSLGFIKPISLPMSVTVTQFPKDQRYFFAVRAIDVYQRYGPFSFAETWR